MKIEAYRCDKCGMIIPEGDRYQLICPKGTCMDLCQKCAVNVFAPVEEKQQVETPEEPKQLVPAEYDPAELTTPLNIPKVEIPEKPNPQKRKKLDIGKIIALKKAGWAAHKIALEMDVSDATIYNVIKNAKENGEMTDEK